MLPNIETCQIQLRDTTPFFEKFTKDIPPHKRRALETWSHDPFAFERSLHSVMIHRDRHNNDHPTKLTFIAANFSLLCAMRKPFTANRLRKTILNTTNNNTVIAISLQYTPQCNFLKKWNAKTLLLVDQRNHPREIVTPFLISYPLWLTEERLKSNTPWHKRKLVFFGGHIPKLYLNSLRYQIWSQVHDDSRVTTESSTINCSVGAYQICAIDDMQKTAAEPATMHNSFYHTFCHEACGHRSHSYAHASTQILQTWYQKNNKSCIGGNLHDPIQTSANTLRNRCKSYNATQIAIEKQHILRDTRRGIKDRESFLNLAGNHKYCLVAEGDPGNSAKITETVALGGAGGCIPVYVLSTVKKHRAPKSSDFVRDFPYLVWLDYCQIAYFVTHYATRNMSRVLAWLERRPANETNLKRKHLQTIRPAFITNTSTSKPSAPHFALSELCRKARLLQTHQKLFEPKKGGTHIRCTLW